MSTPPSSVAQSRRSELRRAGQTDIEADRDLFLQVMVEAFLCAVVNDMPLIMSEQRVALIKEFEEVSKALHGIYSDASLPVVAEMTQCYTTRRNVHLTSPRDGRIIEGRKDQPTTEEEETTCSRAKVDELVTAIAAIDGAIAESIQREAAHGKPNSPYELARLVSQSSPTAEGGWLRLLPDRNGQAATLAEWMAVQDKLHVWVTSGILIAIVGNEKAGMSTLANSLTGLDLLATSDCRCTMVPTFLHLNIHSPHAIQRKEEAEFETRIEYRSKNEALEELDEWMLMEAAAITESARADALDRASKFKNEIQALTFPENHVHQEATNKARVKQLLGTINDQGKEHMKFAIKRVDVWINAPNTAFSGGPPLCFADFPGLNSERQGFRDTTLEVLKRADVIVYLHSVGCSADLTHDALVSLQKARLAANIAGTSSEDEAGKAVSDLPANLFVVGSHVPGNAISEQLEILRATLHRYGIADGRRFFFADARLASSNMWASLAADQLDPEVRQGDSLHTHRRDESGLEHIFSLGFDECSKEWLKLWEQLRRYVCTQLPWLMERRVRHLLTTIREQLTTRVHESADQEVAGDVCATFSVQLKRELWCALDASYQIERLRLHGDERDSIAYLASLLLHLHQRWKELQIRWSGDANTYVKGTDIRLRHSNEHCQQPLLSQTLYAEVRLRVDMEQAYGQLSEQLIKTMADDIRAYLDLHFELLTGTPFSGNELIRNYLRQQLSAKRDQLVASSIGQLVGATSYFATIRAALLLYPRCDPYGERQGAIDTLIHLLQFRLRLGDDATARAVAILAAAELPGGALRADCEQIIHLLRGLDRGALHGQ